MLADGLSLFPCRIDNPGAFRGGSVYVADLATEGPQIGDSPFVRAVCTLARECTDGPLASVELPDDRTTFALTEDGTRTQLALVYGTDRLDYETLLTLSDCRRATVDRLVVAAAGPVTHAARAYCSETNLTVLEMEAVTPRSGPWEEFESG